MIISSETLIVTRATWSNIPADGIHSDRCENLKSYKHETGSETSPVLAWNIIRPW
jgi:hypothetical protein